MPSTNQLDWLLAAVLVLIALMVRVPIAAERQIMPAGDAFNYQHITNHLMKFSYPPQEKRLPVFSALLIPTRFTNMDHIEAASAMSVTMGSLAVGVLYFLGRGLKINRAALLLFLGLSVFDPLLVINSVRPFGDSTFLFFMTLLLLCVVRAKSPWLIGTTAAFLMFTRYEGFIIAGVVFPVLFWLIGWRDALKASIIPALAVVAWIPAYLSIHGSLSGLSYLSDAGGSGFGEVSGIPENARKMLNGARFSQVFTLPAYELGQSLPDQAVVRLVRSPAWWFSLLALLGAIWIVIRHPASGLTVLLAGGGYLLLLSWWWVYSRYVPPLSILFYLFAASGMSALLTILRRVPMRIPLRSALSIALLAAVSIAVIPEALAGHTIAVNNAWESNYQGLALLTAVKDAAKSGKTTAYWSDEHAFATLYLEANGFYFSRHPGATVEDLYHLFQQKNVHSIVSAELERDPRIEQLIRLFKDRGNIDRTVIYASMNLAERQIEQIPVYQLHWP